MGPRGPPGWRGTLRGIPQETHRHTPRLHIFKELLDTSLRIAYCAHAEGLVSQRNL